MSGDLTGIEAHLAGGMTRVCHCWSLTRSDGQSFGFTDHDRDLAFAGHVFKADTGMSAKALQQTPGLAVDNSEALGALSDAGVREEDIEAGRLDGAEIVAWLVRWEDVSQRKCLFRGTIGEITRFGGAFRAELRGLAEQLNTPQGRVYQRGCTAILGDKACQVDLNAPGYSLEATLDAVDEDGRVLEFADPGGFAERWFDRGTVTVTTGSAGGLVGVVKNDTTTKGTRRIELWASLRAAIRAGDLVRVAAGCDKRAETCRAKFGNFLNFRGFPNIPGEDWLISYPRQGQVNDGGSLSG